MDWKKKFKRKSLWTQRQVQYLMCGIDPDEHRGDSECTNEAREEICNAIALEELHPVKNSSDPRSVESMHEQVKPFRSSEIAAWVNREIFPNFPFAIDEVRKEKRVDEEQLSGIKEKNLLRTIGALSLLLIEKKDKRYGIDNKPKSSVIANDVLELLEQLKLPTVGQSKSTYSEVIPKAIKIALDE